jgi:hypothetical protein
MRDRLGGMELCEKERESKRGGRGERLRYFEKWFTKKFSVNRFPNFTQRFSS